MIKSTAPAPLILSLDIGSQSVKTAVFTSNGDIILFQKTKISTFHYNNRIEHDPEEILRITLESLKSSTTTLANHSRILLGISVQRSTIVAWDLLTGETLSKAISWQDTRGQKFIKNLDPSFAKIIRGKTGLSLSPYYGASKISWLLSLESNKVRLTSKKLAVAPLASYLLFHLLQESPYLLDHSIAQRTQLLNINNLDWDKSLLNTFNIPHHLLPTLSHSCHNFGELQHSPDLPKAVVRTCIGDQNAMPFADGSPDKNNLYLNLGTGAFACLPTAEKIIQSDKLLNTILMTSDSHSHFALEATVNGAGAALSWLSRRFKITITSDMLNCTIKSLPLEHPLFLNTVSGLGTPWMNNNNSPRFIPEDSLKKLSSIALVHTVIESVVFLITTNINNIRSLSPSIKGITISGGLSNSSLLCQWLSDLSGLPVKQLSEPETTLRGLAYLTLNQQTSWNTTAYSTFTPETNQNLDIRFQRFVKSIDKLVNKEFTEEIHNNT